MNLPGLKESLEEFNLIGGLKMEKPKEVKIETIGELARKPPLEEVFSDSDLIKEFASHTITLQNKFMEVVDENLRLKKENQRLRSEQQKIREILGGANGSSY